MKSFKINNDTTCIFTTYEKGAYKRNLLKGEKPPAVKQRTNLNNTCLKYFISNEGKPLHCKGNWKNMSIKQRLECNLDNIADGKKYTYELIN